MKKVLSYILISLIIFANLFAPFDVCFNQKNNIEIKRREAGAQIQQEWDGTVAGYKAAFNPDSKLTPTNSVYIPALTSTDVASANLALTMLVDTGVPDGSSSLNNWGHVMYDTNGILDTIRNLTGGKFGSSYRNFNTKNTFILKITETGTIKTGYIDVTNPILGGYMSKRWTDTNETGMVPRIIVDNSFNRMTPGGTDGISLFKPDTNYTIGLYYYSTIVSDWNGAPPTETGPETIPGLESNGPAYFKIAETTTITASEKNTSIGGVSMQTKQVGVGSDPSAMPACGISLFSVGEEATIGGCAAQLIYYVIFVPSSYLFAFAGVFFDYTFAYSVQDSSYKSSFVVQGWGLIRDFCNLFFIFVLLYIAIGTILSLHSVKTKETIVNVVIIGLFINFSLFATEVIIDASNIMARVFYNSNAIVIVKGSNTSASGVISDVGPDGVLPLSAALVSKVNPQNIIMQSRKVGDIADSTGKLSGDKKTLGVGTFIMITLLAFGVNLVGIIVFASVGLIFIARVIGLWLAMIMSPLAFFTYILPEQMSGWKMVGWKNWWPETLKLAFLAPVFIFFLYIILKFLELNLISDPMSKNGLSFLLASIIPFAFIMVLLMKAKSIATDMSGEIGQQITSKLAMAGGLALGAATGGAAMLGRVGLGQLGEKISKSKFVKENGRFGRMVGDVGKWSAKSTFDVRNTKAGAAFSKQTGMDLGKAKEGGYTKYKSDLEKRKEERGKSLEVGEDEHEMHELHKSEEELQSVKNLASEIVTVLDARITTATTEATNKSRAATNAEAYAKSVNSDPNATEEEKKAASEKAVEARKEALEADKNVTNLTAEKKAVREGSYNEKEGKFNTSNGNITEAEANKVDELVVKAAAAQATATASGEKAANAITYVQSGQHIADAAQTRKQAEDDATTAKIAAINKAEDDTKTAIEKAESDKTNAIINANKQATEAVANLSTIKSSFGVNSPEVLAATKAADDAKTHADELIKNAEKARGKAEAKAIQDEKDAKDKATKIKNDSLLAATEAEKVALASAVEARIAAIDKATTDQATATATGSAAAIAMEGKAKALASGGYGKSMNKLETEIIPEQKRKISKINSARKNAYADELEKRYFNKKINKHASHNIRMNSEIKSEVKGH
ncbi:MAG: hypothetical protein WCR20_11585 [Verrucomicrobiota bacterium]